MTKQTTENGNTKYVPETAETASLKQIIYDPNKNVNLKIKEEELDISKMWMRTGDVKVYSESLTVDKSFTVPVERVELVIEKIVATSAIPDLKNMSTEVIRIPLCEESVEFTKHNVALEEVSIYKQKIEDIKSIEATLKREEYKVKISGSLKIKDE